MSRIGKKPITIADKVTVKVEGKEVHIKGPKGELKCTLQRSIGIEVKDNTIQLSCDSPEKADRASFGRLRAALANMIVGVSEGFIKDLEIIGIGYRVQKQGKDLMFSLGYSHPIKYSAPEGVVFEVEGQTKIKIVGIDKHLIGQTAANIRALRKPDSYKGKGIKYSDEVLRKKQGKSVKK